jgi:two-component system, OmpR family, phosphate regulon sensor histidine kinase PhoR
MLTSITRKALALLLAIVLPPVVVAALDPAAACLAVAAALPGVAIALFVSRNFACQVRRSRAFIDRILDSDAPRSPLRPTEDELGGLATALNNLAPKIDDLFHRLRTELGRREAILASMTEGVIAVDSRLRVTFCNNAFAHAIGEPFVAEGGPLIRSVREPVLFQILKEVIESGQSVERRLNLSLPGSPSFEVYAAPLSSTTPRGAIAILHDVTPSERLDRVRRDFVANVSHEFRTPLAVIRGFAETLLDGGLEDEDNRRQFVETILANGIRLNNIAADLLALSELDDGRPRADAGPIPVAEIVRNAAQAVAPAAALAQVTVHLPDVPDIYVWGPRIRLEQALVNLIDNAVKFNRPNGEVRIAACPVADGKVEILISDTGIGIPSHDLSRIFERFYRVDKGRSRQMGGTGLGLSIVKHAIQQMNGTVMVKSELGSGSQFTITLPAYPAPARLS